MTSTSVKELMSVPGTMAAGSSQKTAAAGQVSFQSVLSSQTGGNSQVSDTAAPKKTLDKGKTEQKAEPEKPAETMDNTRAEKSEEELRTEENPEETEQISEEAMEVLGASAIKLMEQIAETFGVSQEELQALLGQMDMTATELLQPENLSAFLLQVGGAEDVRALLTSEELYSDYRQLMQQLEAMLSEESGIGGMNLEQLRDFVNQSMEASQEQPQVLPVGQESAQEAPVVEIVVERTEKEDSGMANPNGEAAQTAENTLTNSVNENRAMQSREKGGEDKGGRQGAGTQPESLFQQILKANGEIQETPVQEVHGRWDADTQNIMRQIMDYMRIQLKPDTSSLEMQLHPANLGTLQISIASKGGVVTANFVAQNETVKAALESQMVQLKENFEQQGVKVEAIEVTVQTHQFEQNLEQGQSRGQNEQERHGRTRRIRLDGNIPETEELSGLEEEEMLSAQMMQVNGNTVDYTA